jgi:hypothetical protein
MKSSKLNNVSEYYMDSEKIGFLFSNIQVTRITFVAKELGHAI